MTGSKRRPGDPGSRDRQDAPASGSGGLVGQIGLFESANGLPHGPMAIVLAITLALVLYPISRLLQLARRH